MIAHESKTKMFEAMRYFLIFYLNLGLRSMLGTSTLDFIQLELSVNRTQFFQNFHF